MGARKPVIPLTDEQREFASQHEHLIWDFIWWNKLGFGDPEQRNMETVNVIKVLGWIRERFIKFGEMPEETLRECEDIDPEYREKMQSLYIEALDEAIQLGEQTLPVPPVVSEEEEVAEGCCERCGAVFYVGDNYCGKCGGEIIRPGAGD